MPLSVTDHDRGSEGLRYVYAVVSRRAGGVSVGINLNPNNACNWACIYCQVPDLVRGRAPRIDVAELEQELRGLLQEIVHGDWMSRRAPEDLRRLTDVALSGNGEPTTSPCLEEVVGVVGRSLRDFELDVAPLLITNGTRVGRGAVDRSLRALAELGGEVWFKVDSATRAGMARIGGTPVDPERHLARLRACARLCPTWIQTCVFALAGEPPSATEQEAYLHALQGLCEQRVPLRGVLLYGLARPSLQPGAETLSALPAEWLDAFARRIEQTGLECRVSV